MSTLLVRNATHLLLASFVCGLTCFLLSRYVESRPVIISGTAVNILTGQPAPNTTIYFQHMNGWSIAAKSDLQGRFTIYVDERYYCCSLFAGPPSYGPLLGSFFTTTLLPQHRGERYSAVVVHAIPATQLAGHIYDGESDPVPGCQVEAFTPTLKDPEHPSGFRAAGFTTTDTKGAFNFAQLGADRFFVLAQCQPPVTRSGDNRQSPSPLRIGPSWGPMLYPQADSLHQARAILLRPGDRLQDIDFHLHSTEQYSVHGAVTLSDGSIAKPWPSAIYLHDLIAVPLDGDLKALDVTFPCDWPTPRESFDCHLLSPGNYQLRFAINSGLGESLHVHPQAAQLTVHLPPLAASSALRVQLKEVSFPLPKSETPPALPAAGTLRLLHPCPEHKPDTWIALELSPPTAFFSFPQNRGGYIRCSSPTLWTLPAGHYQILAVVPFGRNPKLSQLLQTRRQPVSVRAGKIINVTLHVWTSDEILRLALGAL